VIDRRAFISALAGGLLAPKLLAEAQPAGKPPARVGVLLNLYPPDEQPPQALRRRLRDLGYVEGQNLVIDWWYQLGGSDRLPALAGELVRFKPDVIVADVAAAIRAAMQASSTIPIVMATSADAVGGGLVSSLRRPGGNVTGVTIMLAEMTSKPCSSLEKWRRASPVSPSCGIPSFHGIALCSRRSRPPRRRYGSSPSSSPCGIGTISGMRLRR
jgi:putative ABC transport system substrate-binding protein